MRRIFDYLHEHIVKVIVIVAILTAVVSMIFIFRNDGYQTPEGGEIREYQSMKTVYFAMDKVKSLNPLSSQEEDTYYISKLVFSSLFRFDENMNLQKDLVKSYETDAKEGKVEIKMRADAEFSDGTDLTAYDVRYTVDQIGYIGEKCPYYAYADKIDYVEVEGDTSLTVYFENPADAALDNLTFPIVSSYLYSTSDEKPVGSGLYKYGSYANHKTLKLNPNKEYYGGVAKNKLVFKVISDKTKVPGLMTIDSVTAAVTTDSAVAIEAEDKKLQVTPVPSSEMEYMGFNFKHKYLKDARVRKAIAKTIDLNAIINDSYGGAGMISDTVYFPGFLGTENGGDPYEQDQVGASRLLKECGFKDSDENGILEDKDDKEFTVDILVNENAESRVDAADTIAAELQKIGIKAKVIKKSWKSYRSALRKGRFDIYLGGYRFDDQYNLKEMFAKNNFLRYNNQDVLKLVKKMETAINTEKQKATYEELKPMLIDELPYYCIAYKTYSFLSVERFTADVIPSYHHRYAGCDSWQWEKVLTTKVEDKNADK
ncbi:MAG: ABC transporter substrate-binding protein [Firmicutes bacterium]|nr:ABC transporter substrate-binding protein [Bacillota bacterium]